MGNLGHRIGGDFTDEEPNSVASLEASWSYQHSPKFKYHEFDLCETKDKQLCVIHDRDLGSGERVKSLTMDQIRAIEPWRVNLFELLKRIYELDKTYHDQTKLIKPIMIELKRVYSFEARGDLLTQIHMFKDSINKRVPVHCIVFNGKRWPKHINHFEDCFPDNEIFHWKKEFAKEQVNLLNIYNKKKDCFGNPLYVHTEGRVPVIVEKLSFFQKLKRFFKNLF